MMASVVAFIRKAIASWVAFVRALIRALTAPRINSLVPDQGAPGSTFVINGSKITDSTHHPFNPPEMRRGTVMSAVATTGPYESNRIRALVPTGLVPGYYQLNVFGDRAGAYEFQRSNTFPFLVLASTVAGAPDDPWAAHVRSYRVRYGKSMEWETWMIEHRSLYAAAFEASRQRAWPIVVNVRYHNDTQPYATPWPSEDAHMADFKRLLTLAFPGFDFDLHYDGAFSSTAVFNIYLGAPNPSHVGGTDIYLHWETIAAHEFGHPFGIEHHYPDDTITTSINLPPGETRCTMARNSTQYCSACRTAMGIPLDVDTATELEELEDSINSHYPPDW
jgi:hypothetical protein